MVLAKIVKKNDIHAHCEEKELASKKGDLRKGWSPKND